MAVPTHWLNLYQRPKQGTSYLGKYPTYKYKHRIASLGGFDTASCIVPVRSKAEGEFFLEQHLGCRVTIVVDNPAEPAWEGFINRITFSTGRTAFTISLDEMYNRVAAKYMPNGGTLTTVAAVNDTDSQAVYGIKQGVIDLGWVLSAGTRPTDIINARLADVVWPKKSVAQGDSGEAGFVRLELLGFYHTLRWQERNYTGTALRALNVLLNGASPAGIIKSVANGTTFFDNTNVSYIAVNATTMNENEYRGKSYWDVIQEIAETGDSSANGYVAGITVLKFGDASRYFYYQLANLAIEYTANREDGMRIRTTTGRVVLPWTARPDRGIRMNDWQLGGGLQGNDPREEYVGLIDYDADSQTVRWSGVDSLSVEGAFQLRRGTARFFTARFGASPYRAVTG